ncbi:LOW QUALITY PROTEIN: uncharacterized protein LOC135096460 [Scylla paramamosain]|uniref:LOW QUALITY PROTEIN: uncharacterized protein LOC135096460 n=1 Tax=Scylla paramamosain TaxID=85552 RepID=UPI00308324C9
MISGRHTCVGLTCLLQTCLAALEDAYPGLKDATYKVGCEEEVDNIEWFCSGSVPPDTCEMEHVLLCIRVRLCGRAGVMLLDPGYHVGEVVTVMEDGRAPTTGFVQGGATSGVQRWYRYRAWGGNAAFVTWEVVTRRGGGGGGGCEVFSAESEDGRTGSEKVKAGSERGGGGGGGDSEEKQGKINTNEGTKQGGDEDKKNTAEHDQHKQDTREKEKRDKENGKGDPEPPPPPPPHQEGQTESKHTSIIFVGLPFLSPLEVAERRNIAYPIKSLVGRDSTGALTSGLYFPVTHVASAKVTLFTKVRTQKGRNRFSTFGK